MIFVITAFLTNLTWKDTLHQFMKENNLSNATFVVKVHEEKKASEYHICNQNISHKPNLKRHIETVHEGKNLSNATFVVTGNKEKKAFQCNIFFLWKLK